MPSKLILDPENPEVKDVIARMVLGEPLVLREVTVVPTIVDPENVEADVVGIVLEPDEEAGGIPIAEGEPGGPAAMPDATLTAMPRENEGGFDEGQL